MKKYNKFAYLGLIIIILLSGFFIYKVSGKNYNEDVKSKTLSDVKQIEKNFVSIFNQLNNITFDNYKFSASKLENSEDENSDKKNSNKDDLEETENSKQDSQDTNQQSENGSENKQYKLEEVGILTMEDDINWTGIKNDVENLYTLLYSTTLDLYQTNSNEEKILNFNKEYDNLTKAVKEENKEQSLTELSILYNYLPDFVENCTNDEKEKIIINTKNYIFKAYSILDNEDWTSISDNISKASEQFTKLVTNINNKETVNQYNINKIYIMINELQNAIVLRDKEIFLIKYKKLLEEIQNI